MREIYKVKLLSSMPLTIYIILKMCSLNYARNIFLFAFFIFSSFPSNMSDRIEIAVFRFDFRFCLLLWIATCEPCCDWWCYSVCRRCTYRCESIHFAYWFLVSCVIHTRKCNDWMCLLVVIGAAFIPARVWGSCTSASQRSVQKIGVEPK